MDAIDIAAKLKEANEYIFCELQEHAINHGTIPLDFATGVVRAGVGILLAGLAGDAAVLDEHVIIRLEKEADNRLGIVMAPKSEHGRTIVDLFSLPPDAPLQ